jgi:hypothetical protein
MSETWKPIEGFEFYDVSDEGRVRSWRKFGMGQGRASTPRVLKPYDVHGYRAIKLRANGIEHHRLVHVLVAEAFIGPRPTGDYQCAHENGIRGDNHAVNLQWKTRSDNSADKVRHGTTNRGDRHYRSKLTVDNVIDIRNRVLQGAKQIDLAREFDVSRSVISSIVLRRSWAWVKEPFS